MRTFETLPGTIDYLKGIGYSNDFNLHPEWIECPPLKLRLAPEAFHVDQVHCFEGVKNPDDSAILFAINSSNGIRFAN